jgi:hypothetical protein
LLKGDANTKFFHAFANGRKRKCAILSLTTEQGVVTDIQELIYGFYRNLMGAEEPKLLSTVQDLWPAHQCVSAQENEELMRSFTEAELDFVLQDTKSDTAPGPVQEVLASAEECSAANFE